jgi:DNA polymerase-1
MGLAYRGHYAFARNPLRAADGRPTSAVFSFLMTLLPLLEKDPPTHAVVVFDAPGPTFRDSLLPEYKATRAAMPDELFAQLDTIKEFVRALGLHIVEIPGVEADDVLATLACSAAEQGMRAVVLSMDKDLLQIVSDSIVVIAPPRAGGVTQRLDPAGVQEKFGVPPERVVDVLALVGDAVDNVPGVPGIGMKTASKLVQDLGTLDDIYARLAEVKPERIRRLLAEHRDLAFRSRTLITLQRNTEVELPVGALALRPRDRARLRQLCQDMSFRTLAARFAGTEGEELSEAVCPPEAEALPSNTPVREIASADDLTRFAREETGRLALGLEGSGTDPYSLRLLACALWGETLGGAVVRLRGGASEAGVELADVLEALADRTRTGRPAALAWNVKAVLHLVAEEHFELAREIEDVHVLLASEGYRDSAPDDPAGVRRAREDALFFSGGRPTTGRAAREEIPQEESDRRALEEARALPPLAARMQARVANDARATLYRDLERPLVPVLARMERRGVRLDTAACAAMSTAFEVDLNRTAAEIYRHAGTQFNILSVPELRTVLFDRLKLRGLRRTKTGYSTDSVALEELAAEHPIAQLILDYRQVSKLRSTYLDALPRLVNPTTGRVHTTYHQIGASTGRLSSSDPNLQNIPIRWPPAREIRKAFVPGDPSWRFIGADYSQIELRFLAHFSGEETLVESFRAGEDVHARTAALVSHVPIEKVTPEQRGIAKTVNFAVIYGQSPFGLAQKLGLPLEEARAYIDEFFRLRPKLTAYLAKVLAEARERGYTTTILGRRRYFTDLGSPNPARRQAAERAAINAPIQGSAADLIKCAMLRVDHRLRQEKLRAALVLQVHDELLCEAPLEEVERVRTILCEEMEGAMDLTVPLKVDLGVGRSWFEVH